MDQETWRAKALKDNRGRSLESQAYRPEPGIELGPLVTEAPGSSRGLEPHAGWIAMRTHTHPTSDAIRADLAEGIQGIRLDRRALRGARDLAACMKGVDVENVRWTFAEGDFGSAASMVGLWRGLGMGAGMKVGFGLDPLGTFAREGFHHGSITDRLAASAELAAWTANTYPQARTFELDGSIWHDAGADDSVALGLTLSNLVACLRAMETHGLETSMAFEQVGVRLAVGGQFLLGIASLRAMRRLLGRIGELCGADVLVPITATAAQRELTRFDPAVNILRTTAAAFAGIVGGAEVIDLPTWAAESPERARLARNTQTILREEAHLDRVADPAGGSYALESLTDQVAQAAWKVFQGIEAQGGLLAAIRNGDVAQRLRAGRERREQRVRTRASGILGVSCFANLDEGPQPLFDEAESPTALRSNAPEAGSFAGLLPDALRLPMSALDEARLPRVGAPERCEPCGLWRAAEIFEQLRDRRNAPAAFLAPLGTLAQHTARSAFGQELLAAGGIRSTVGTGSTLGEAVEGYRSSGARIAVVSATGSRFTDQGPALVAALKQVGAAVWVLGDPGDQREAFERAGAKGFLHQGIDVYAALLTLWEVR